MREKLSFAGAACLSGLLLSLSGCNLIFGIQEGVGDNTGGTSSTTTDAGSSGAGGTGAGGAAGSSTGACGPRCGDGDYGKADGPCAFEVLYKSVGTTDQHTEGTGVVVDEKRDQVLWAKADAPALMATPRSGGASVTLTDIAVQPDAHYPWSVVLDGSLLYWNTFYDGSVARLDLSKPGAAPDLVASAPGMAVRSPFVLHGGEVFFATMVSTEQEANPWCHDPAVSGEPFAICTQQVWRAGAASIGQTAMELGMDGDYFIPGVAADETRLYWTECLHQGNGATLRYVEGNGNTPQTLLELGITCGGSLAVEPGPDGTIYLGTSESILRINKLGQNLGPLVQGDEPWNIIFDDEHVYWLEGSTVLDFETEGSVRRVAKSGGAPVVMAPAHEPGGLAQDCGALYWTNSFNVNEDGSHIELRKVSK
jgi:hypothetical protein